MRWLKPIIKRDLPSMKIKQRSEPVRAFYDIDLALEALPPDFLYHGTAEANISSILEKGIEKETRQHVHLSADKETATKVGMRHGKPVILTIRTGKCMKTELLSSSQPTESGSQNL
jgi:RNA:NAD 2'-phosphotransferase (TPT1/KptA family)